MSSNVVPLPARDGLVARIAENVRVECARQGWNQSDLARALGWVSATVSKRWYGARQWQLEDLDRIADALGVPVDRLLAPPTGLEPVTLWLTDEGPAESCGVVIPLFGHHRAAAS